MGPGTSPMGNTPVTPARSLWRYLWVWALSAVLSLWLVLGVCLASSARGHPRDG